MHQSLSDQNTDRQSAILPHPQPGLPDFFVAYGQNPDKNGQNGCFLKKLWPKPQNVSTIVISILIGVSNCLEDSIFFAKKMWFCQISKFLP